MGKKRFSHDQFFAAGLIGSVEGTCRIDRWTGFLVLDCIDWDRCSFCVDGSETGEPVIPTPDQEAEIMQAIREALSGICDAAFSDRLVLRQDSIPAL